MTAEAPSGEHVERAPVVGEPWTDTMDREFTLAEVAELTDMTARNIRAYAQRKLLPPPVRRGRHAAYTYEHVTRVQLVRALHGHGLTLRLIGDLVDRGTAASELARLGRDDVAQAGTPPYVPMNPANVAWYEQHRPGALQELASAHVIRYEGGRPMASAAGLGVTGALAGRGYDLDVSTRLSLLAAAATESVAVAVLEALHDESARAGEEDLLLLVQLAATAFGDSLRARVTDARA